MTEEQMLNICSANPTNKYICKHLDDKTMDLCMDMLLKLDANDFKEINLDAEFDFTWLPIPYDKINKDSQARQTAYSPKVEQEFEKLLNLINKKGTNKEYSYILSGLKKNKKIYTKFSPMCVGTNQAVDYDWKKIEKDLQNNSNDINYSIFHTHPKAIGEEHKTLYNKHKEIFEQFGVKPDGLNLSLSDIYANQYLDMLCQKCGRDNITCESTVLMHDGTLISFSTKNGVKLTSEHKIELNEEKVEELELI